MSFSIPWNSLGSCYLFSLFLFFRITMPKCHKLYPNCIWNVPPDWFDLSFNMALLTKVYLNYVNHIVHVCVSSETPINLNFSFTKESNLPVKFGSKAMASPDEPLFRRSPTNTDPLLEELRLSSHHQFSLSFLRLRCLRTLLG